MLNIDQNATMQLNNVMSLERERESIKASCWPVNNQAKVVFFFAPVTTHVIVGHCHRLHLTCQKHRAKTFRPSLDI